MDGATPEAPVSPPANPAPHWILSLIQIITVSGFPTQIVLAAVLIIGFGMSPYSSSGLSLEFIATVSFLDTALVSLLILVFLRAGGESTHAVFFGGRPLLPEIWRGVGFVPVVVLTVLGRGRSRRSWREGAADPRP